MEILAGPGHSLLQTNAGPLDVLGAIEGGRDYDALLPSSRRIEIAGRPVHVLDLAMLIVVQVFEFQHEFLVRHNPER